LEYFYDIWQKLFLCNPPPISSYGDILNNGRKGSGHFHYMAI